MKRILLLAAFIGISVLAACGSASNVRDGSATDLPARVVEDYIVAKASGDQERIRAGLCAEMESVLERELRAFESVSDVKVENMSCASDDVAAESETVVRCTGEIVALYGTEETSFPLAAYRAVSEDGEWKWCGESE